MEFFQSVRFFTDTDKFNRLTRYGFNGQGCAAASITVELGHNNTVNTQSLIKGFGRRNGILTRHSIDNE